MATGKDFFDFILAAEEEESKSLVQEFFRSCDTVENLQNFFENNGFTQIARDRAHCADLKKFLDGSKGFFNIDPADLRKCY